VRPAARDLLPAIGFSAGMVVFALAAHRPSLLAPRIAGAALAAACLAVALAKANRPAVMLGFTKPGKTRAWFALPLCLAVGIAAGMYYRTAQGRCLFPAALTGFCLLSTAIGGAEELAYRGFVQSQLRRWGPILPCIAAAGAHTAYKCALFAMPAGPERPAFLSLALGTLIGGTVFGLMRQYLGSIAFPLAAHVAFDVIVYGDLAAAPWWA
jgi:membrane protease YdiL (CAAX protease family)